APRQETASANATANNRIETGIDLRGTSWQYVRVYSGAGAGQIAHISTLGNGFIQVDQVWNTTSKILDGNDNTTACAAKWAHGPQAPNQATWYNNPQAGDKYVLVENSLKWPTGTPAVVTVEEVLADTEFRDLNRVDVQGRVDGVKTAVQNAAGATNLVFVSLPGLFLGKRGGFATAGFATDRSATAFTPGLVNFQPVNGKLYMPRQFGPRNAAGNDMFEVRAQDRLPAPRFVS